MSYALMRRFAFIEVTTPPDWAYDRLLEGEGELVQKLLPLRTLNNLGPAIYVDAKRYVSRRERDDITESRLLYEIFYAFFLPQFEGIDEHKAVQLYRCWWPSTWTRPSRPRPAAWWPSSSVRNWSAERVAHRRAVASPHPALPGPRVRGGAAGHRHRHPVRRHRHLAGRVRGGGPAARRHGAAGAHAQDHRGHHRRALHLLRAGPGAVVRDHHRPGQRPGQRGRVRLHDAVPQLRHRGEPDPGGGPGRHRPGRQGAAGADRGRRSTPPRWTASRPSPARRPGGGPTPGWPTSRPAGSTAGPWPGCGAATGWPAWPPCWPCATASTSRSCPRTWRGWPTNRPGPTTASCCTCWRWWPGRRGGAEHLTLSDGSLWSGQLSFRHPAAGQDPGSGLAFRGRPLLPPAELVADAPWAGNLPADGVRLETDDDLERLAGMLSPAPTPLPR